MKSKFKKQGKGYLPLGTLEGRALNNAIKKWVESSLGPFIVYLGNEIRREFRLPPSMMSLNFSCCDDTIFICATGEELFSQIQSKTQSKKNWPNPECFDVAIEVVCTNGDEDTIWSDYIGIAIMQYDNRESGPYWVAVIGDYQFSLEEQMSLRKAQEIVENVLLSLRIQVMVS